MTENTKPANKSPSMKLMKGGAKTAPVEEVKKTTAAPAAKPASKPAAAAKPAAKPAAAKPVEPVEETTTAAAATTEAVDSEEMTQVSEDLIEQVAYEVENIKEEKAFKLVPTMLNTIDRDYFRLGGYLSVIQREGWYMDKSYENFRAYVEAESGMAYRKAIYLIQIYNGLVQSKVQWADVAHLGWTKLKELANILTPENVAEWVALAENMTVLQLQDYIKKQSAGISKGDSAEKTDSGGDSGGDDDAGEAPKVTTMTFKVHPDQKVTIREALDKCKHESGTDVDTFALENICLNFLGGTSKLATMPTLAEMMQGKSAEEVLGVFGEVFPDVELEASIPE